MTRKTSSDMIKLKRGSAPGLQAGRVDENGRTRYRWVPAPRQRKIGYKSLYLRGTPGTEYEDQDWLALGFTSPPLDDLTLDGPPMGLERAITACKKINDATKDQSAPDPNLVIARRAPLKRTLDAALNAFLEAGKAGKVLKRGKGGKPEPVKHKTIIGYQSVLGAVRAVLGDLPLKSITHEEFAAVYEAFIENDKHTMAVRSSVAVSRALNWLKQKSPEWGRHIPDSTVYSGMGLGKPEGRLRMADPEEADLMFEALKNPAALGQRLGLHKDDIPEANPAAAAMWQMSLWTIQRLVDVVSFNDNAFVSGRLIWRQSKRNARVDVPLLDGAKSALLLARATRSAMGQTGEGLLFWTAPKRPYLIVNGKPAPIDFHYDRKWNTDRAFRDYSEQWRPARELAAKIRPSLTGEASDKYGDKILPLLSSDARDTGVTRLFLAMQSRPDALVSIAAWHGSKPESLMSLFENYLVMDPAFADHAGDALREHAARLGYTI